MTDVRVTHLRWACAHVAGLLFLLTGPTFGSKAPPPELLNRVRARIARQDFAGGLALLRDADPQSDSSEAAALQSTCWLGSALQADNSVQDLRARLTLSTHAVIQVQKFRQTNPDDAFLANAETLARRYADDVRVLAAKWPVTAINAQDSARQAIDWATRARTSATSAEERAAADVLTAWSRLVLVLLQRANVKAVPLFQAALKTLEPQDKSIVARLGDEKAVESSEIALCAELARLLRSGAASASRDLSLGAAECLTLYAASRGVFRRGQVGMSGAQLRTLPREDGRLPAPSVEAPRAPAGGPRRALMDPDLARNLAVDPEPLVLPACRYAAECAAEVAVVGPQYLRYLVQLRYDTAEAGRLLRGAPESVRREACFRLEEARFALRIDSDPKSALASLVRAVASRALNRPLTSSLPGGLQQPWLASSHARELMPQVGLGYDALFRLLDAQAADAVKEGTPPLPQLSLSLGLAELLMTSNLVDDRALGITRARSTLHEASRYILPEEQQAQLAIHHRRIEEAVAGLPQETDGLVLQAGGVRASTRFGQQPRLTDQHRPYLFVSHVAGVYFPAQGVGDNKK